MSEVIGVRFKRAGRVYYFDPAEIDLELNDYVVVETAHGQDLGKVVITAKQVLANEIVQPLKTIVRKATPEDLQQRREQGGTEEDALAKAVELATKYQLPIKFISAECSLDGNHITIFFTAEGRIDFRELARDLSHIFRTHVELRQIGPRDEAKLLGGVGKCGRPLCCAAFLSEFNPVSIKMAKDQDLPLNPMKISGACGRLLCCLGYESEQYRAMKEKLPKAGQSVLTSTGKATVVGSNPMRETVVVETVSKATMEIPFSEILIEKEPTPRPRQRKSRRKR